MTAIFIYVAPLLWFFYCFYYTKVRHSLARIVKICAIHLTLSSRWYILDKVKYGGCPHVSQNFILLLHHFLPQFFRVYRRAAASRRAQLLGCCSLFIVGKHPGCSPSELTKALYLDWGYSQRSLNKLVADGFLSKEKHGRSYTPTLTDRGQQAFVVSHKCFHLGTIPAWPT